MSEEGEIMKLHVHVTRDETGYFVAEVPALPGCLSQGKTREEALVNIQEAIEGWFEVMEPHRLLSCLPQKHDMGKIS